MNKLLAFSVFDVKADVFNPPFFLPTRGLALRSFADMANDASTFIGKHPSDYKLVLIGAYDQGAGVMTPEAHESMGFGVEYVKVTPIGMVPAAGAALEAVKGGLS